MLIKRVCKADKDSFLRKDQGQKRIGKQVFAREKVETGYIPAVADRKDRLGQSRGGEGGVQMLSGGPGERRLKAAGRCIIQARVANDSPSEMFLIQEIGEGFLGAAGEEGITDRLRGLILGVSGIPHIRREIERYEGSDLAEGFSEEAILDGILTVRKVHIHGNNAGFLGGDLLEE
jgi:hypothetical protein